MKNLENFTVIKIIHSGSSLLKKKDAELYEVSIDRVKLDTVIKNFSDIRFVKIDVEGAELLVLNGMQNIIKNNKKFENYDRISR